MKIIGITGGIGSGKSTVCSLFRLLGAPVYNSDLEAKRLYENNEVIEIVSELFGKTVIRNGKIQLNVLSKIVFQDNQKLIELNNIIHPRLRSKFTEWCAQKEAYPYVLKEAAIMIETNSYLDCHELVLVLSPIEKRIERVIKRNCLTREEVIRRISKQLSDDERTKYCKHTVYNNEEQSLIEQVNKLNDLFIH